MTTVAEKLAGWAGTLGHDDIPESVIDQLEEHVLDTMGVLLAATPMDYAGSLAAMVLEDQGLQESTLIGRGGNKVPVRDAIFVNGALGHGIDWDDTHLEALLHPTATILPPVLAICEAQGRSGADLITGLAIGVETMVRIGIASGHGLVKRGLHPTSMCGTFGVAIAAGWLFGLDRDKLVNSLGIAGGMCAGLHESVIDGSMNKCIHSGVAAQAGFAAAELARAGFTGPSTIFEGLKGFQNAFVGKGEGDVSAICRDLGSDWHAGRLAFKAYACCQGAHPSVDAALALFHEHGVRADEVEKIVVRVGKKVGRTLCEPKSVKQHPPSAYGAKFSIPFAIASALSDGRVVLDSFSEMAIADPKKLELAERVEHLVDSYYDYGMALRGSVFVKLKDGRTASVEIEACTGTPENPWSTEGIVAKFNLLAEPVIGAAAARKLAIQILQLDKLPHVMDICGLAAGGPTR